ncbi:hypothetical protein PGB90_008426 [Kerria lacca]
MQHHKDTEMIGEEDAADACIVSWKRLKDYTLLTVGSTRYTASNRFVPEQVKTQNMQHWRLLIKFVQHSDAGIYECQVSTYPPAYIHMRLKIIDAYAEINGSPELYIKNGSQMHLICRFIQSTEEPSFVFWYHENMMINFDEYRGISTYKNKTGSGLTVSTINHSHSGNYSCVPSNTRPASILVHILDGEQSPKFYLGTWDRDKIMSFKIKNRILNVTYERKICNL